VTEVEYQGILFTSPTLFIPSYATWVVEEASDIAVVAVVVIDAAAAVFHVVVVGIVVVVALVGKLLALADHTDDLDYCSDGWDPCSWIDLAVGFGQVQMVPGLHVPTGEGLGSVVR